MAADSFHRARSIACALGPNRPLTLITSALVLLAGLSVLILFWSGCADSTQPGASGEDTTETLLTGNLDPDAGTFVLDVLTDPPPGPGRPVRLIGSNLQIDRENETVSLEVALQNLSSQTLYAPASVWLTDFRPADVSVANPDMMEMPQNGRPAVYGFDYSDQMGDGQLAPEEISASRTWVFQVPGLVPFSFGARVQFGLVPDLPRIAGVCFEDVDRDGLLGSRDRRLPGGRVVLHGPEDQVLVSHPNLRGAYAFPVATTGLYSLQYHPPLDNWYCLPVFTSPNPREVLLLADPNGEPQSFLEGHFGFYCHTPEDSIPPVILTEAPLDSLVGFAYDLLGLELVGDILHLRVGFSGCQPLHPFTLYMFGGFMESLPVQANLVLVHELEEDCEAYWAQDLVFDLDPIRRAYIQGYGEPGLVILHLWDFQQEQHTFTFGP